MKSLKTLALSLLLMSLGACGGGGNAGIGNGTLNEGGNNSANIVLFVGDEGNHALAALTTLTPAAGTNLAANVLGTNGQQLWNGIALDAARDRLYASNGKQIAIFEKASRLNGVISPTRVITPAVPGTLSLLYGLVLDKTHDRLYFGFTAGMDFVIGVYDNVSTLSGNAAPTRMFSNLYGDSFTVDTQRNVLYTTGLGTPAIYAYPNIDKLNGPLPVVAPAKPLVPGGKIHGLAVDEEHDRLYIGAPGTGVAAIDKASTGSSIATIIGLANSAGTAGVAYDMAYDRLYVGLDNSVFVLGNASLLKAGNNSSAVMVSAPGGSKVTTFAF
jgi:hypothetical protein